jgi:hypothetical protein
MIASTKTAAESPVRKGGGEWRVVIVGVQDACPRGFQNAKWVKPISL